MRKYFILFIPLLFLSGCAGYYLMTDMKEYRQRYPQENPVIQQLKLASSSKQCSSLGSACEFQSHGAPAALQLCKRETDSCMRRTIPVEVANDNRSQAQTPVPGVVSPSINRPSTKDGPANPSSNSTLTTSGTPVNPDLGVKSKYQLRTSSGTAVTFDIPEHANACIKFLPPFPGAKRKKFFSNCGKDIFIVATNTLITGNTVLNSEWESEKAWGGFRDIASDTVYTSCFRDNKNCTIEWLESHLLTYLVSKSLPRPARWYFGMSYSEYPTGCPGLSGNSDPEFNAYSKEVIEKTASFFYENAQKTISKNNNVTQSALDLYSQARQIKFDIDNRYSMLKRKSGTTCTGW